MPCGSGKSAGSGKGYPADLKNFFWPCASLFLLRSRAEKGKKGTLLILFFLAAFEKKKAPFALRLSSYGRALNVFD